MIKRTFILLALAIVIALGGTAKGYTNGLLDGRKFSGLIGPAENPDLPDSLFFDDGHFWSDICTRCGFVPGKYKAEKTIDGISFHGILESESRGRFDYNGIVKDNGAIEVMINWERRRWYWTSTREIVFLGEILNREGAVSLSEVRFSMKSINPDDNPMCARF